jgi:predicted DNA-binding transcriptional regulator AlpA
MPMYLVDMNSKLSWVDQVCGYSPYAAPAPIAPSPPSKLMGVQAVADALGISTRSVWRLASGGKIPKPIKLGHKRLWGRIIHARDSREL